MKNSKKILALALALVMALALAAPAMADDDPNKVAENGNGSTPVNVTIQPTNIDVTGPTTVDFGFAANSNQCIVGYDAATQSEENETNTLTITNNSGAGKINVASVQIALPVTNSNNWELEDFTSDFSAIAVNSRKLGVQVKANAAPQSTGVTIPSGSDIIKTGDTDNKGTPNWVIDANGALSLTVTGKAPVFASGITTEESAARILFVVEWKTT